MQHLQTPYLHQFARAVQVDLFCQLRGAEHFWSEVVDVSDGLGADSLQGNTEVVNIYDNNNTVIFIL